MSEVAELERAMAEAAAAMAGAPGADPRQQEMVARAASAAVRSFRRFEAHPASLRPPGGTQDPLRDLRHDVRSAAQTVLAQLEMIGLAWSSWDAAMRAELLDDLTDSERRLAADVDRCLTRAEAS
ncbi:MAG: hypothetical protein ABSA40_03200 [Candidatus Dormibacteria bacterium]